MFVRASVRAGVTAAVVVALVVSGLVARSSTTGGDQLFTDDLESGTLALWGINRGLVVQQEDVASGVWAARATSTGTATYARAHLAAAENDVRVTESLNLLSQGSNPVTLSTLQTARGRGILSVYVTRQGKLATRNVSTALVTVSNITVSKSVWQRLTVRVTVAGADSEVEVSLDGVLVPSLSGTTSLGTTGISRLQIGDTATGRSFDVTYDDIAVTRAQPDTTPPTAPADVSATAVSSGRVDLAWSPATDDVGVSGYQVYRDGNLIAAVSAATTYSDASVQPSSTYSYEVRTSDAAGNLSAASDAASVTTPDATDPAADPVIAAAGDIACSPSDANYNGGLGTEGACQQLATSNLLLGGQLSRVLPLGDLQYEKGALNAFLASYEPTWGRLKTITSPALGNHEYGTPGAAGYFDYFGEAAGDRTTGYYSYDIGAWHLIALNSNCAKLPPGTGANGCAEGSPQNDWLEQDLAAHPAGCTLAYFHHPRFSSGLHGNIGSVGAFWTDLYDANADVILNGHDHGYQRFTPMNPGGTADPSRGIREFVVGTGGDDYYPFTTTPPATSEVRQDNTFGVLKMTLHPNSYDWTFVPETGETFTDNGTQTCH